MDFGYFRKQMLQQHVQRTHTVSFTHRSQTPEFKPSPSDSDHSLSPGALQLESFPRCKTQVTQVGDEETGANSILFCHKLLSCCMGSSMVAKKKLVSFFPLFSFLRTSMSLGEGKWRVAPQCLHFPFPLPAGHALAVCFPHGQLHVMGSLGSLLATHSTQTGVFCGN